MYVYSLLLSRLEPEAEPRGNSVEDWVYVVIGCCALAAAILLDPTMKVRVQQFLRRRSAHGWPETEAMEQADHLTAVPVGVSSPKKRSQGGKKKRRS